MLAEVDTVPASIEESEVAGWKLALTPVQGPISSNCAGILARQSLCERFITRDGNKRQARENLGQACRHEELEGLFFRGAIASHSGAFM